MYICCTYVTVNFNAPSCKQLSISMDLGFWLNTVSDSLWWFSEAGCILGLTGCYTYLHYQNQLYMPNGILEHNLNIKTLKTRLKKYVDCRRRGATYTLKFTTISKLRT